MPKYSFSSIELYDKKPGPWSLKDTGSMYAQTSIASINDEGFELNSTSETSKLVVAKLAKKGYKKNEVFGLSRETREISSIGTEIILPALKDQMKKQTGFTF